MAVSVNGSTTKWLTSAWITLVVAIAAGSFTLGQHLGNGEIHEASSDKEVRIHSAIDREVRPSLDRMQLQLDRIERKLSDIVEN